MPAERRSSIRSRVASAAPIEEVKKEVTAQWALYALAFAFVASLGAVSMAARWP